MPLTSTYNQTVAEALVALIRHLHTSPKWTHMVNRFLLSGFSCSQVASLAFLGGVTNKPSIGGQVLLQDATQGESVIFFFNHFINDYEF